LKFNVTIKYSFSQQYKRTINFKLPFTIEYHILLSSMHADINMFEAWNICILLNYKFSTFHAHITFVYIYIVSVLRF